MRRAEPPARGMGAAAAILSAVAVALGALAAMPIYRTPWVWVVAGAAWALACAVVWAGSRLRWGPLTLAALILVFVVAVVPLAVPSALDAGPAGLLRGLGDGLAAVVLGWKQLLTLTLPVGTYQAVLTPLLVVAMGSTALMVALALRSRRVAPFAAIPALVPATFGVVFGSSQVSAPLSLGPVAIAAPRELALWGAACVAGAVWVRWSSGIERRAALRLGRSGASAETARVRRNGVLRAVSGVLIVLIAGGVGIATAPLVVGERSVPRDRIDPELVVREQTSPLAAYRTSKRDDRFAAEMFRVGVDGEAPNRLRIAVLDAYDGVDFFVSPGSAGRFTRFPSGEPVDDGVRVRVEFADGYDGIWLPLAPPLAAPPRFLGDRAGALADAFYVNRDNRSAIAVPGGRSGSGAAEAPGVRAGDGYEAVMSRGADPGLPAEPAATEPLLDLEAMPQLARWLEAQQLPSTGAGLAEAIERLRARGYLSHSLTDGEGERDWWLAVAEEYGTKFMPSPGGHSVARIEQLFAQLNEQANTAGEGADDGALVAGVGDDEQFATAAALLARAMGFESRVVLGVRLGSPDDGVPGVPACERVCTGEHLAAWIEVRGARGEWAPLDASPQTQVPPSTLERGEQLPEFPTVPEEHDARQSDPPSGTSEDTDESSDEEEPADDMAALWPILRAVGLSLLALLLLALPIGFLPVAKRIRTRRRRAAGSAEVRALGAWDELLDRSADAGRAVRRASSRRETAAELGGEHGEWIAWTVDRAVYAREGITDEEADRLWAAVDEELAARRGELGFWRRLAAGYSLRSLVPERRRAGARRNRRGRRVRPVAGATMEESGRR